MNVRRLDENDAAFIASAKTFFIDGFSEETFKSSFQTGRYFGFAAGNGDADIGYIIYSAVLPEADIESVFVFPGKRRKGVGKTLLERAIEDLKKRGANKVFLEVRKTNTPAVKLYESAGFEQISVRKKYYGDEDALVMVKEI